MFNSSAVSPICDSRAVCKQTDKLEFDDIKEAGSKNTRQVSVSSKEDNFILSFLIFSYITARNIRDKNKISYVSCLLLVFYVII